MSQDSKLLWMLVSACFFGLLGCRSSDQSIDVETQAFFVVKGDDVTLLSQVIPVRARYVSQGDEIPGEWRQVSCSLQALVQEGSLVCTRQTDGPAIRYLALDGNADSQSYGVYGLFAQKNGVPVPLPTSSETINWSDCDAARAFLRLLAFAGLSTERSEELLETHREEWFREGLRVFFFLPPEAACSEGLEEFAEGGRSVVVSIELSGS